MAELTLKDESVLQIGKSVANSFEGLASSGKAMLLGPTGQPLNNASDISADSEPETEKPASIGIFESIREKISDMVGILSANFAFDKKIAAEESLDARVDEAQETETGKEDSGPGFLSKITDSFKDKISSLGEAANEKTMAIAGGLKGMLVKGGLIFGLLALATMFKKYGKEIAEVLTPIVDGIRTFFTAMSDDIKPLFDKAVAMVKDAIGGLLDIFKGLFTGDASTFLGGVKKLFIDFPIKLVSYIGDAFFTLVESALAAFGIESEMVTNIKNIFRNLPETIKQAFEDAMTFITETIPQFFTDMKDAVVDKAESVINSIKNFFTDTYDSIKNTFTDTIEGISNFFGNIADKIKTVINTAIEGLPLPGFIKDKLKLETRASAAADADTSATGGMAKYAEELTPGQRTAMTGSETGLTGGEALAESQGERYYSSNVKKMGTSGYDMASGIMTEEQFKEFQKIKDVDQQLAYLKSLDDEEQERRAMILELAEKQKEFNKKMAALEAEKQQYRDDEFLGPDDQMLRDDQNIRAAMANKTGSTINTESAAMNNANPNSRFSMYKGGNTNTNVANNTYTTILEDTKTSDGGLREALSA